MTDQRTAKRTHLSVTNSELSQFRSCRQKWWFVYHELLRPKRTPRPFAVGSSVHAGLGAMYQKIQDMQVANGARPSVDELTAHALKSMKQEMSTFFAELLEALEEAPNVDAMDRIIEESEGSEREAESSVIRFVDRFGVEDFDRYQVVAVERAFHVPLVDVSGYACQRVVYSGVWDAVFFDLEIKDFVLAEHKTTSADAHQAERKLDMDPQTTGYLYGLRETLRRLTKRAGKLPAPAALAWAMKQGTRRGALRNGEEPRVGRIFYNVVRKKGPQEPKLNKPGKDGIAMVSSAAVDTTRDVYEQALRAQEAQGNPRTEKQTDRLNSLQTQERYVVRLETFTTPDMIERWRAETLAEAGLLRRALRGAHPITRNAEMCNPAWAMPCRYRSICIEDAPERRQEFKVVSDPHSEVIEAEEAEEQRQGAR